VILVPILIVNCTLIIKSYVNKDEIPDFGGMLPLIVLTDSMYPEIKGGDLIICKTIDPDSVEVEDVVSFYDPEGSGTSIVTHKVVEIIDNEDGTRSFRTRGINNNTEDRILVHEDKVVAEYTGIRIGNAGHVAMFMQSTSGLIVCVILPIILFVGYDVIRRKLYEKNQETDVEALKAELEALRSMQNAEGRMQNEESGESVTATDDEKQSD
jgi:signal peptidase